MNLLLVDDEIITIKGLITGVHWKDCGIDGEIFTAGSAKEALDVIARAPVDVILCDIEMPGENGIELIRQVRELHPEIVSVFLTCHAKFEYAQEALRLGCQNYILKPAPFDAVASAVQKAADAVRARRSEAAARRYGAAFLVRQADSAADMQGAHKSASEIVAETTRRILENLGSQELSVSSLASQAYLNKDYLNRIFRREKGVSISQFIISERMELAAKLLENPALNVASVASQVGYGNYPHFASTFKRHFGCTPSDYRR